jgi:hypothetical protein
MDWLSSPRVRRCIVQISVPSYDREMKRVMRRKLSKSDLAREPLAGADKPRRPRVSSPAAISDVIGSVDRLPSDLTARTKKYLKSTGYGSKHPR